MSNYPAKHILKMIIFGFKISFRMVNSIVNWEKVTLIAGGMDWCVIIGYATSKSFSSGI